MIIQQKEQVHADHCCWIHGCKYGDDDCPVEAGRVQQQYRCHQCQEDGFESVEDIQAVKQGNRETCVYCGHLLPINTTGNQIKTIIEAIRQYHLSLDQREHGGVAQDKAIHAIEGVLGMPWRRGEELAKQHSPNKQIEPTPQSVASSTEVVQDEAPCRSGGAAHLRR